MPFYLNRYNNYSYKSVPIFFISAHAAFVTTLRLSVFTLLYRTNNKHNWFIIALSALTAGVKNWI